MEKKEKAKSAREEKWQKAKLNPARTPIKPVSSKAKEISQCARPSQSRAQAQPVRLYEYFLGGIAKCEYIDVIYPVHSATCHKNAISL